MPAPTASQGPFAEALSTITFTSKVVLWNKHEWAIRNVVVKDILPVPERQVLPSPSSYTRKVVLRKPEGLADAREGTEVEVGVKTLCSRNEKAREKRQASVAVKDEESEGEYVQVEEKLERDEEIKSKKDQEKEVKQVKVMWEKCVDGTGGEKEGRFEWRCEEVGAGERVVLEAQWEIKGALYDQWVEVSA
jgi:hypothetical protein